MSAACWWSLRDTDIIARLGGDEFAVILHHVNVVEAQRIARDLVSRVEACPFLHAGHRYLPSASAGVAMVDAGTASAEDAMVEVDIALTRRSGPGETAHAFTVRTTARTCWRA